MTDYTPNLKLVMPAFDQTPWSDDINNDLLVLDAAVARFLGTANMVGVWGNATSYAIGQVAVDVSDGSMWTCAIANTSAAAPTTFSQDRTNNPTYWINAATGAQGYALQAQAAATAALTSANNAASSAATVANMLPKSGGTMTGDLTLHGNPTTALMAAPKQYVDTKLPLAGGTVTGPLTVSATAVVNALAVTPVNDFLLFKGPSDYYSQYSTGYYWDYVTASGNLQWVVAGTPLWIMRTSDKLCYNNQAPVGGNGAYVNVSDERVKHDIAEIPYGVETISRLCPVEFIRNGKQRVELGFTAQDVIQVLPEAVSAVDDNLLAISSEAILAVAIKAIQQLTERVAQLEANAH